MNHKQHEKSNNEETEQRLQAILSGAFAGSPTPLKDIPKRNGKARVRRRAASDASAKTAKRRRGKNA